MIAHHPAHTRRATAASVLIVAALGLTACGSHHANPHPGSGPNLSSPPSGLRWEDYRGIAIPMGDDGPSHDDQTATGYTHTPQGAALAGIDHSVRMAVADDATWPQIAASELESGPGKDAWVLARVRVSITSQANPATAPTIVGYRITAYRADHADVTVYTRYSDGSLAATATRVDWTGDDWRLELPDPATKTRAVTAITSLPADIVHLETTS